MTKHTYQKTWNLFIWTTIDIIIIVLAYIIALYGQSVTAPFNTAASRDFIPVVVVVTLALHFKVGVYKQIWARSSGHEIKLFVYSALIAVPVLIAVDVSVTPRPLPVSVVLLGHLLAISGFVAARYRSRLIDGLAWRWRAVWNQEFPTVPVRTLIIGAGEVGQLMAWRLKYRSPPDHSYRVLGYVDDAPTKQGMYVEGCPVLGRCTDIPELVQEHNIDLLIFAINNISGTDFRRILSYCEQTAARIKIVPDVFGLLTTIQGAPPLRQIRPEDFLGRKPVGRHADITFDEITHKTILVTGAAGSIGSELCSQLLGTDPVRLIMLDNNESGLHDLTLDLQSRGDPERIVPVLGDITDLGGLRQVFEQLRPQIVFHAAAYKHVPILEHFPREAVRVNIQGTRNIAQMALDYHCERFVCISTDKAVNPTCVMGLSKRLCELVISALAQQNGHQTRFTSVRFGNVLGSRGSVVVTFERQIAAGGPVTVTHKNMSRYFMSIPEAVNLVIHAACLTTGGDLFMLEMGEEILIRELAERMIRLHGLRPYTDIPIVFTTMRPGEKLHEELHTCDEIPENTRHPGIFQLTCPSHALQVDTVLNDVEELLTTQWEHDDALRDDLQRTINSALQREGAQQDHAQTAVKLPAHTLSDEHAERYGDTDRETARLHEEVPPMKIPMSSPDISQADIDAVTDVLRTRWLSLGPKIDQFEGAFAAYVGTKGAIGVNSGTSGLHLAMIAAGVGRGDEVITPSFSFIASANCILYQQAHPVFVDIDPMTYNLYPHVLEAAITERTKAIIVVHAFGQPADMDSIMALARNYNLIVIEDACEAIGAEYKHRKAGTLADAAVFAFYPNKQMTTGEGGMLVTDNEEWITLFRSLRNQGRDTFNEWLDHARLGFNYRMDEMSAALGLSQLQRIDMLLENRDHVANWYNQRLEHVPHIHIPYIAPETTRMSWFVYVVRLDDSIDRHLMMQYLKDHGVPSRPYFSPIHLQPIYQRLQRYDSRQLAQTEKAGALLLALPFSGIMTEEQVEYVCQHIQTGIKEAHCPEAQVVTLKRSNSKNYPQDGQGVTVH